MIKNLFWTGGFDSTFRLLQIINDKKISSVNLYFLALNIDNIDNTSLKRRSIKNEIESINKILMVIDTSKIKSLNIYGPHKDLIEYKFILKDYKFINFIIRDEINYSNDLINAYSKLYDLEIVPRLKSQYGAITQIINELNIESEVCVEKDGGIFQQISKDVDIRGRINKLCKVPEISYVFGKYQMPLFWIEKKHMLEEASFKDWIKVLSETWSCWYPVDNNHCGKCFSCNKRPFLSSIKSNNEISKSELIDYIYSITPTFNFFSNYEIDLHYKEYNYFNLNKSILKKRFQETNSMKITANIATQPKRFYNLLVTLESIKDQFDEIRIYLNNYTEVPEELEQYTTFIGKDLTDNGKMFWSSNPNEYYFTLDDDIIYPSDYVEKTIPLIKDRIVCYHGHKLLGTGQSYYNSNLYYSFRKKLDSEKLIEVGGTGVMAFNTNIFKPTLWKSPINKMCDIIVGLEASLYDVPIMILPHETNWIVPSNTIESEDEIIGIWEEFKLNDYKQSIISDMIQLYKNSQLSEKDKLSIAGSITKEDVYTLYEKIEKHKESLVNFYHIGSGDGKLICQLNLISDFEKYIGIDTVSERIKFANSLIELLDSNKIEFHKKELFDIEIEEKSCVYINDITMTIEETIKIWEKTPIGCTFICSNILPEIFPIEKITVQTNWNKFLKKDLYLYLKVQ